ncbi:MAG TPA: nuclear transport factor 2 family protein [Microbacteriaceae bacterium]|jgi:ketosteroid isomerase-like protein|nr:nuclear transport factor 2 family protein [Microbacteriaceae bacterium]
MSQENVELFRRANAAINRGDVEYAIRHSTEDVVIIPARSAVEGHFVGHEGVRKFFADNAANFELFHVRIDDVRDLGDDRVLGMGTIHIRGRVGGVETDIPMAGIATYRHGKMSRWEDFRERRAALAAVGLAE